MTRWLTLLMLAPLTGCMREVPAGYVGVTTKWGAVVPGVLDAGTHLLNPLVTRIRPIDARVQMVEVQTKAASKDLQVVDVTVDLNFRVIKEEADALYINLGELDAATNNIVLPVLRESVKVAAANYTAEELITRRADMKKELVDEVTMLLKPLHLDVVNLSIAELIFNDAFTQALVDRQVSAQAALKALTDLKRVETEAEQAQAQARGLAEARKIQAAAEAEAQRILSETVDPLVIQLRTIERWDGKLPQVSGSGSASISLPTQ